MGFYLFPSRGKSGRPHIVRPHTVLFYSYWEWCLFIPIRVQGIPHNVYTHIRVGVYLVPNRGQTAYCLINTRMAFYLVPSRGQTAYCTVHSRKAVHSVPRMGQTAS